MSKLKRQGKEACLQTESLIRVHIADYAINYQIFSALPFMIPTKESEFPGIRFHSLPLWKRIGFCSVGLKPPWALSCGVLTFPGSGGVVEDPKARAPGGYPHQARRVKSSSPTWMYGHWEQARQHSESPGFKKKLLSGAALHSTSTESHRESCFLHVRLGGKSSKARQEGIQTATVACNLLAPGLVKQAASSLFPVPPRMRSTSGNFS